MTGEGAMEEKGGMKFEEKLARLETIVSAMEAGNLPLDDMMRHFDEGKRLASECTAELETIRKRIEKVVSGPGETVQTETMDMF